MKKLFLFLVLSPLLVPHAIANPYQGIRYATTEGKVYEHLSGQFAVAASTISASTYTITLNGTGGVVTATSFVGSGAALTGVLTSPATFSYLVSPATFTFAAIDNSSYTLVSTAVYSGLNARFDCVAGSTITLTVAAGARILVGASTSADTNTAVTITLGYLVDGGDVNGQSATIGRVQTTIGSSNILHNLSFTDMTPALAAGAHTLCLKLRTSVPAGIAIGSPTALPSFWAKELR